MVGFVILHYQNIEVTKECINYIKKLNDTSCVVIVDNCSLNKSGVTLKKEYEDQSNIHVILNDRNSGFASGNNIGYLYAKKNLKCDTIIVMNSDVFIYDKDFLGKVAAMSRKYADDAIFAVDIISRYGGHQNPFRLEPISSNRQHKIIARKRLGQIIYSIPLLNTFILSRKPKSSTAENVEKINSEKKMIIPHGACLIYLPEWVKNEDICFLEGTFLFCEEEILFDYAKNKNYCIRYIPSIEVHHLEDASQDEVNKTLVQKKKMQLRFEIQSRKILLKYRNRWRNCSEN